MNMMWLEQITYVIFLMAAIPIFHEMGHAFYLTEKLKKKIKFKRDWKRFKFAVVWEDDGTLTKQQEFDILSWGIMAGMIPFLIVSSGLDIRFFWVLFVAYFFLSCRHDWKEIWRLVKNRN